MRLRWFAISQRMPRAFASPISHWLGLGHDPTLVRAGAVGLWAQTNYQQLTALFRVEERSTQYAIASVANVLITVLAMVLFVAVFHWGAVGLVVGNFTGTLAVYAALLAYRTEQLGLEFDRTLFRKMQSFGMPLVPSALALWVINFVDREFVSWYKGNAEVGVYSAAVKIASVITFVMMLLEITAGIILHSMALLAACMGFAPISHWLVAAIVLFAIMGSARGVGGVGVATAGRG